MVRSRASRRGVALEGDPHDLVARPDGEQDLRRRGEEGHDPHGADPTQGVRGSPRQGRLRRSGAVSTGEPERTPRRFPGWWVVQPHDASEEWSMTTAAAPNDTEAVRSLIPFRMDRLPWAKFHWLVVVGLGVSWILDGLEIQLVSSRRVPGQPRHEPTEVGFAGTVYLVGQVVGALTFGRLTDKLGPQEAVHHHPGDLPHRLRHRRTGLDAVVPLRCGASSRVWGSAASTPRSTRPSTSSSPPSTAAGSTSPSTAPTGEAPLLGALASFWLLDTDHFAENVGWRIAFFIGPVMGLIIIWLRRHIPESPRWMVTHGQGEEAERIVDEIEESGRGARARRWPRSTTARRC